VLEADVVQDLLSLLSRLVEERLEVDPEVEVVFLVVKVVNGSLPGPFLWDRQDSLALLENVRDIRDNDAEEAADSAEPLVSRNRTRPTVDFEVLKESQDHWCIKIFGQRGRQQFFRSFRR
jgi:hypothetical protein